MNPEMTQLFTTFVSANSAIWFAAAVSVAYLLISDHSSQH